MISALRRADFSIELAYHSFLIIDSYLYGFILHEVSWQFEKKDRHEVIEDMQPGIPDTEYPHLAEIMEHVMKTGQANADAGNSEEGYESEFEFGLDLILNGLERLRDKE